MFAALGILAAAHLVWVVVAIVVVILILAYATRWR